MTINMRYSFIVGAVFIWSVFGFAIVASALNLLSIPSTGPVFIMRAMVAGLSLVLLFSNPSLRIPTRNFAFLTFALFFVVYALRVAYDTAFEAHLLARPAFFYWAFTIGVCLVPAAALGMYAQQIDLKRLYWPLMGVGTIILVIAIFFGGTIMKGSLGDTFDSGRLMLESLNPISLGHIGASVLVLGYWRMRMSGVRLANMFFTLTACALGGHVMLATGSRGPFVAFILAIVFFEVVKGGKAAVLLILATAPLLATVTFDLQEFENILGTNLLSRLDSAIATTDASSTGRIAQVASAWRLFLDAPILGSRLEDPAFGIYPHNIIVEAFMATGVFGGITLILLLFIAAFQALKIAKRDQNLSLFGALYVQYLVGAQFSGSIYTSATLWAMVACIFGLARANDRGKTRPSRMQGHRKWFAANQSTAGRALSSSTVNG